jgi:pyruvate dehydrogenase E2 component (dihydrolipoamide acetyltransferase)
MALIEIKVPDLGEFHDVDVIEVMVKPGDRVGVEQSLITIESEKATMEVPSPQAGVIKELKLKLGDKVSEGSAIVVLDTDGAVDGAVQSKVAAPAPQSAPQPAVTPPAKVKEEAQPEEKSQPEPAALKEAPRQPTSPREIPALARLKQKPVSKAHASPSVRKFARDLGVDLNLVNGAGPFGRVFRKDVENYVKSMMTSPARDAGAAGRGGLDLLPWPKIDFARFGPIESKPLSRIRKISRNNLARNWVMIPHVTQFDEADVTELEAFRHEINQRNSKEGVKVTMLAFILKALVAALTKFPEFNSSLDGDNLIYKKYFHFGFAVDTADGLIVPVIRDVDRKGVVQIARETAELAARTREGKLKPTEIQGAGFTVSSLGGIGGTMFTPIINAPEVAILGVSKLAQKPVYRDGAFIPRQILPLSLSYDHRVIDGATAARFITFLSGELADLRRALL